MDKIIILGHENPDVDSVVSGYLLEKILNKKGHHSKFLIPDESIDKDTLDICNKYGLNPKKFQKEINQDKYNKYILVDHHERDLDGEIIAIIDHHPTSKNIELNNYYNQEISSTALYIYKEHKELLDKNDVRLVVVATLIDTVSFHSDKGKEEDKCYIQELCQKYDLNYNDLYKEGLILSNLSNIKEASLHGLKKHNINNKKVYSSYIQIENKDNNQNEINKIIDVLKEYINKERIYAFIFIVHDMTKFQTMYYLIKENDISIRYYNKYTSRGNTIIPEITKMI